MGFELNQCASSPFKQANSFGGGFMKVLLAVLSSVAFLSFSFAQSDLAQFCQGLVNTNIRDESDSFTTRQTFDQVKNILFTQTELTFSSAQKLQNDLGIKILDYIDLTLGGKSDESNFESRKETVLRDYLSTSGYFSENIERIRNINESLANSIDKCIVALSDAVTEGFFPVVTRKDDQLFQIEINYKINAGNPRPLNLTIDAFPENVQCRGGLDIALAAADKTKVILCKKPMEEAAYVVIKSDILGDKGSYDLPAGGELARLSRTVDDMKVQLSGLSPIPRGTVGAFELAECPSGWDNFAAGAGRTIIGVGQGNGLTSRILLEQGGEEMHTLTEAEMPSHTHAYDDQTQSLNNGGWGDGGGDDGPAWRGQGIPTSATGGNQPHNNMPPYLALLFCKKQ
jgi:hypothetical protein